MFLFSKTPHMEFNNATQVPNTPTQLGNVSTLQTVYKTLPFCFESKKMFTFSVHMWVQICYSKLSNGYLNLSRTWLFCIKIQQILTFIHTLYIYTCIKVCTIHEMGMWKTLGVRTHIFFAANILGGVPLTVHFHFWVSFFRLKLCMHATFTSKVALFFNYLTLWCCLGLILIGKGLYIKRRRRRYWLAKNW